MFKKFLDSIVFGFFYIFIIPDTMLTFLSGIFVAAAINIVTSQIPNSILSIGGEYLVVALLFLIMAISLIGWSLLTKEAHIRFDKNKTQRDDLMALWYETLVKEKICLRLSLKLICLVSCLIVSIILLL